MSPLREALRDYLQIRRSLGFKLDAAGRLLEDFVGFLEQAGATRITTELARSWARLPRDAQPLWWRRRLGMVRGFARYLVTIDPQSEVPSRDLLPSHQRRVPPYIYSEAEIAALMDAARALTPPLAAATCQTVIGLMAATGLRLGEALGLDRQDVDLTDGVLHVRVSQSNPREVPLHETTIAALRSYARVRDRHWPTANTAAFFVSRRGLRLPRRTFHGNFQRLIRQVGLEGRGHRARPRPHDLRHAYAVRTLLDFHAAGLEVDRELLLLSTILGHDDPTSTFWYLEAVPELMSIVAQRLNGLVGQS